MGSIASIFMAACLTAASSLRAFLTLFVICLAASQHFMPGFALPPNILGLNTNLLLTPTALAILGVLAVLEIIFDKFYSPATFTITILAILRPLAAILSSVAVLHFASPATNWITAIILGICLGQPLMTVHNSLIPRKLDQISRIHCLYISIGEDIAACITAVCVFYFPVPLFFVILAAFSYALVLRKEQQNTKPQQFAYKAPEMLTGTVAGSSSGKKKEQPQGYGARQETTSDFSLSDRVKQKKERL